MSKPDSFDVTGNDLSKVWARAEPVDVERKRPPTSVLSLRIPNELLRELGERARQAGKSPSAFVRDVIESSLSEAGPATPSRIAKRFSRWVEEEVGAESIERSDEGPMSSFVANRLALASEPAPSIEEMGLAQIRKHAFAWQGLRSQTQLFETWAVMRDDRRGSEWLSEIGGLFGITAELVLVAIEAEGEKKVLERHLDDEDCGFGASHWRSLRFFADGQINYLVIAGHMLSNLALRTLALHPDFEPGKVVGRKAADVFKPEAEDRRAWISFNHQTLSALDDAAISLGPSAEALVQRLRTLADDEAWTALFALRDSQYHRWRGESPGVTGIARGESVVARLARGEAIGLGPDLLPPYEGVEEAVLQASEVGRQALLALDGFMPEFLSAWESARESLE